MDSGVIAGWLFEEPDGINSGFVQWSLSAARTSGVTSATTLQSSSLSVVRLTPSTKALKTFASTAGLSEWYRMTAIRAGKPSRRVSVVGWRGCVGDWGEVGRVDGRVGGWVRCG